MSISYAGNRQAGQTLDDIHSYTDNLRDRSTLQGRSEDITPGMTPLGLKQKMPVVYVDKEHVGSQMPGVYSSINDAIAASEPSVIKIASNLYEE